MIIQVVKNVDTCMSCPNFRREYKNKKHPRELYRCAASDQYIGGSDGSASILYLRNNVSMLCPFKDDNVNQKQKRDV